MILKWNYEEIELKGSEDTGWVYQVGGTRIGTIEFAGGWVAWLRRPTRVRTGVETSTHRTAQEAMDALYKEVVVFSSYLNTAIREGGGS